MTSEKKIQANRANAAKSTGPKTDAGKARARLNAVSHGIFARDLLLDTEDAQVLDDFRVGLLRSLHPRNSLELQLAEQIISAGWRLKRVLAAEKDLYDTAEYRANRPTLDQRQKEIKSLTWKVDFARECVDRARTQRKARKSEYDELVAQLEEAEQNLHADLPGGEPGELLASMLSTKRNPAVERLRHYERGLENTMHRAINQLRQLQKQPLDETENEFVESLLEIEDQQVEEDASPDDTDEKTKPNSAEGEAEPEDANCDEDADSDEMTNDETRIANEVRMTKLE